MTTFDAFGPDALESPAPGVFRAVFDTPFARRSRVLHRRIAALRALSDADLADLGLVRTDIVAAVLLGKVPG